MTKQVGKVIWHKAVSPQQTDADSSIVFTMCANVPYHEGTLAPPGEYDWTCASFGHPSPQPKRQVDWLSHFCTAHGRKSLYFTMGAPFPQNCPFLWGSGPHLIYDSLGPPEHTTQKASQSVQPFLHRWPQSVPTLYNGIPLLPPKKIAPSLGDLDSI